MEMTLAIISAFFVLYTAMIDPAASLIVAAVAIVCLILYRVMFGMKKKETIGIKKQVTKRTKSKAKRRK